MYQVIKQVPFIRLVIPLISGIMLEYYFAIPISVLEISLPLCIVIVLLHHWLPLKLKFFTEAYYGIILTLFFIFLGAYILKTHKTNIPGIKKSNITRTAEVIHIPKEKENSYETVIKLKSIEKDSSWTKKKAFIIAYFAKTDTSFSLKPGDDIVFNSYIHPVRNSGNPFEFNYKRYLAIQGIHHQTYIQPYQYRKIHIQQAPSVLAFSNNLRLQLLTYLKNAGLKNQNLAIGSALSLGYKELLNKRTKSNFSNAGATHILAVSGLHVGIIFLLVHYLLLFMERNKTGKVVKTILIILLLGIYALITGLSPSVTRATLMFSIIAIGKISQQNTSIYNNLALSAFILLLLNPLILFSVGFQLSYAAVISIVFFQPKIYNLVTLPRFADKLWQWFSVAIAAQIGTAPLIIHYFHQFPNYFWLTNFLAIPAATIILILGMFIFITSPVVPILAYATGFILNKVISALNFSLHYIQNLPLSVSHNLYMDEKLIPFMYVIIALFTLFLLKRNMKALIIAFSTLCFILSVNIYKTIQNSSNKEFIILNIPNHSVYNYIGHETNLIFTENSDIEKKTIQFAAQNLWLKRNSSGPELINLSNEDEHEFKDMWINKHFLFIGGKKFCRVSNAQFNNYSAPKKLSVDYLIIAQNAEIQINALCKLFDFKKIIIDSSNSYYHRKRLIKKLKEHNLPYHSVAEKGAFHLQHL